MTTLRIFINQATHTPPDTLVKNAWALFDGQGRVMRQGEDLLSNLPIADHTELILPAEWVSLVPSTLPAGNRKRIQEALPYLIEEHIIANPEQVHVVIAHSNSSAHAILASVDKQTLSKQLAVMQSKHIEVTRALPATLCTPSPSHAWHWVIDTTTSFLRTGEYTGFALAFEEATSPPVALTLAIAQAREAQQAPNEINIYGHQNQAISQFSEAWSEQLGVNITLNKQDWKTSAPNDGMNFLQGAFAPKHKAWAWIQQAKPGLMMLAGVLLVSLIGSCLDWAHHAFEKRRLDQAMHALFLSTFPDAGNVVNAPLQMQRKLAEMQHANGDANSKDFLPILAHVSQHVGALSALNAMHYQEGLLSLEMHAANQNAANALAQKIVVPGRIAVVEDIKASANGIDFKLVFKADGE